MFHEFPKALTNANGEQIIVADAAQEAEANKNGFWFGGVEDKPKRRKKGDSE